MKNKIIGVVLVTTIAVVTGWNLNQSKNETKLSELTLSNVEALASGEGFDTCFWSCKVDPYAQCHVFGGFPSPTYCFYYRAN